MSDGEPLPPYMPAITLRDLLLVKFEYATPFRVHHNRSWTKYFVTLNSTQIIFQPVDHHTIPISSRNGPTCLTLQYATVGFASDYEKRPCSLRLRSEGQQILIDCNTRQELVSWINGIQLGINLSLDLEIRDEPVVRSVPRRFRRDLIDPAPPARSVPIASRNTQRRSSAGDIDPTATNRRYTESSSSSSPWAKVIDRVTAAPSSQPPSTVTGRPRSNSTGIIGTLLKNRLHRRHHDTSPETIALAHNGAETSPSWPRPPSPTDDGLADASIDPARDPEEDDSDSDEDPWDKWKPTKKKSATSESEINYAFRCLKRLVENKSWQKSMVLVNNTLFAVQGGPERQLRCVWRQSPNSLASTQFPVKNNTSVPTYESVVMA
ncbi:hypothetical protein NADFUDRAFT_50975 [Nadsonia fulvescens var. elongata DSM 6958]|uniref:PH domain-containing protein n=1 Tax=Nadsonia fulvescens var. elongata DSM 6958 TaxID=857566 RepID=A0A1E3PK58_9ASCO|nr:hypothetical protein NADFUDRAFT_50975 [Nadsonia fulvescens var. elongata DSM 6958]